jgi:hypothetical protein
MIALRMLACWSLLLVAGCTHETESVAPQPAAPVAPLVEKRELADWCGEHGVPESVCTRCNPKLIASFQQKGDWCKKHELPDSQCIACHPELAARFAAMAPKAK